MQRALNISREQLTRQTQPLTKAFGRVRGIGPGSVGRFSGFPILFYLEFCQQLFAQGAIASRGESQHFAAHVWRSLYRGVSGFGLLLFDIFLHFAQAFLIHNLSRVPGLAEQSAGSFRIGVPKNIGDPCQSARAQFQIAVTSCVGGQRNQ